MVTCMGCGRREWAQDVAWQTVTITVAGEADSLALCGECASLLKVSDRGLLFGAKTAIHQRFRLRVADAMMREVAE